MAKIKLTKNELKKQKDELKMFTRYLPTLQLKKQQLQSEIRTIELRADEVFAQKEELEKIFEDWISVFADNYEITPDIIRVSKIDTDRGNIAGVRIPIFRGADFEINDYDLFLTPLWVDKAIEKLKDVILLDLEIKVLREQIKLLKKELRVTSQRVNLFEKIKIPDTKENIKKITIYLGDQQTAAVVRGKISKGKIVKAGAK